MKLQRTTKSVLCLLTALHAWIASSATFEEIRNWTGTGTNRAALVLDWRDGRRDQALVWGYRWNGQATGADMFRAVVAADDRLFAHLGELSWGTAIFGVGYHVNQGGPFATTPPLAFDAQGLLFESNSTNADDTRRASDDSDHFAEGWSKGYWAYYLRSSESAPWKSASTGPGGRTLSDGAWDGFSFAANFAARPPSDAAPAAGNPFAVEIVASQGPFGPAPYDDPASLLGMPSKDLFDAWGSMSGRTTQRKVKLVEPAYNLDATRSRKLITTLAEGSSVVVRLEEPVTDDPGHPYGIDLLVFGNAFYPASGSVNDGTDMNTLQLTGGGFFEGLKVSVSPGYTDKPGQNPTNSATWDWYRFDKGPYADAAFPTQAYHWNRTNSTWSTELMDFTKPVNPAFAASLEAGGLSAADAIDLYDGSGGGTGFDIAESGFGSVQYVRIDGLPGFSDGEIDAVAAVRPSVVGDSLTIARDSVTNSTSVLRFQHPAHPSQTAVALGFTSLSENARVASKAPSPADGLGSDFGRVLTACDLGLAPVLGTNVVKFSADLRVGVSADFTGDATDVVLLRKRPAGWEQLTAPFDAATRSFAVSGVTNLFALAVVQVTPPRLAITRTSNGTDAPGITVGFAALPGFSYVLQRSAAPDFREIVEVSSVSPGFAQESTLVDGSSAGTAFYRVRVSRR